MTITDQNIPSDPLELRQFTGLLMTEVKSQALMIEKLRHQLFGLRKNKFGSSGESLDQLGLRLEDEETDQGCKDASTDAALELTDEEPAKVKPVRRALPQHLPRADVTILPEATCVSCGDNIIDNGKTLGEDVTEELEYVPGRFVVNRIVRPRLSCTSCESIAQAPMPSRPIPKSYAGPGLLASIIVNKYCDHLPLYRQNQIMKREGIDIDRSTLAGWVGRSAHLLERLSDKIRDHVLASPAIFADDTPIKLLAPGSGKTKTSRMWSGCVKTAFCDIVLVIESEVYCEALYSWSEPQPVDFIS